MKKLLTLSALLTLMTSQQMANAAKIGDQAPSVELTHIEKNGTDSIRSVLSAPAGQAKVLEFFSITCGACAENLPLMKALEKRISGKGTINRISVDRNEQQVRNFVKQSDLPFAVALDSKRVAAKAFTFVHTPELYVLDSKNKVIFRHEGVMTNEDLRTIEELVEMRR